MSSQTFQAALGRLVNDVAFRDAVTKDGSLLTKEFELSVGELGVLMTVGHTCIGPGSGVKSGGESALAVRTTDVNCCCCCCCP